MAQARRVLVLGATSLIGRRLVAGPWPDGVQVVAISRTAPPEGGRGDWIVADLVDEKLVSRMPVVDAILSLSPIWLLPKALPALLSTGVRRIVAFSSTSAVTKAASPVAEERAVAARLAAGEAALAAACDAAGVEWTVLRPTLIYAEGEDANVSRLARLIARFGVAPLAGRGQGLRQPVHAADLAAAAWRALDAPAAARRTYDLPGGETLSYRAMVVRIFEALGRSPRIVEAPLPLWRLGLALASPLMRGATAAMGARMAQDLCFDAGPAARDFGYAPRPFRPDFTGVALSVGRRAPERRTGEGPRRGST